MPLQSCRSATPVGVRFKDLSVSRNGRQILDGINAIAPCGSATVIIGPNGAGKTTLLRCLLDETSYAGEISFFLPDGQPCRKPVIGYVPQHLMTDSQMPLRVYEFLALAEEKKPLWLGCSPRSRQAGRRFLQMVGSEKLEKQRLGDLSGGELRRVLLASALSRRPDLLILDEAEAGVDYRGERMFWQLLDKTRKEFGFTLIMVSHNLPLAAHYASHVLCIKQRLLGEGLPRATLTGSMLLALFGVPIHLYPNQCEDPGP
ncbi:MAG: metal ABC transporter ATP-binding protein, partial [Desulfovibrio sp.]|nr:metal ABC transporter ATP-binding protein [Desulfovibrio sp.]